MRGHVHGAKPERYNGTMRSRKYRVITTLERVNNRLVRLAPLTIRIDLDPVAG